MKKLLILSMIVLNGFQYIHSQSSRVFLETNGDGDERNQLDIINHNNSILSASILRFFSGTGVNQVESGIRNLPYSYAGVDDYGDRFVLSNSAQGIILRNDVPNSDMRFLIGGFPINQHQKMILDQDGNLGIGAFDPVSKLQVKGGDIFLEDIGAGVIMKSPNGKCWRMTVTDAGTPLFTDLMGCP